MNVLILGWLIEVEGPYYYEMDWLIDLEEPANYRNGLVD